MTRDEGENEQRRVMIEKGRGSGGQSRGRAFLGVRSKNMRIKLFRHNLETVQSLKTDDQGVEIFDPRRVKSQKPRWRNRISYSFRSTHASLNNPTNGCVNKFLFEIRSAVQHISRGPGLTNNIGRGTNVGKTGHMGGICRFTKDTNLLAQ